MILGLVTILIIPARTVSTSANSDSTIAVDSQLA